MILWLLLACTSDILEGEWILPGEITGTVVYGESGEELGGAVAYEAGKWLAGAPQSGRVLLDGEEIFRDYAGRGQFLWFDDTDPFLGVPGVGIVDLATGEVIVDLPEAMVFAGGEGQWTVATAEGVHTSQGQSYSLTGVRRLAVDGNRILALACNDGCEVWEIGDTLLALGNAGPSGAVGFWNGEAWWSDPQEEEGGRGLVYSEGGAELEGLEGDHLGRSLGGGYVSGAMNWRVAPRRIRLLSLEGQSTLAVVRSAGARPVLLAGDPDTLVVGIPGWTQEGQKAGATWVVEKAAIP